MAFVELGRPAGLPISRVATAVDYAYLGRLDQARGELATAIGAQDDAHFLAAALAQEPSEVKARLTQAVAARPHDTVLNRYYAPMASALLLWRGGRAAEAVRTLQQPSLLVERDIDLLYWRGMFQLDAGDAAGAAQSFRALLAKKGFGYTTPYDLARLGLARALSRQGEVQDAVKAYDAFLAAWKDADAGLPALQQAKAEQAQLLRSSAKG